VEGIDPSLSHESNGSVKPCFRRFQTASGTGGFGASRSARLAGPALRRCAGTRTGRPKQVPVDERRPDLERVAHAGDVRVPKKLNLEVLAHLECGNPFFRGERLEVEPRRERCAGLAGFHGIRDFRSEQGADFWRREEASFGVVGARFFFAIGECSDDFGQPSILCRWCDPRVRVRPVAPASQSRHCTPRGPALPGEGNSQKRRTVFVLGLRFPGEAP
jgi:hypothetical protein